MKKLNRVGEIYTTKEGYKIEIIEYIKDNNCTIKFENGLIKNNINFAHIKTGKIKNPYHLSVYNNGYIGQGIYPLTINRKAVKSYNVWNSMLQRCYDKEFQKKQNTYIGCYVYEEWKNYQNFAKWFEENYIEGFELDKDILIKENKEYGPNTCCFVPQEINHVFIKKNNKISSYPVGVRKDQNKFSAQISMYGKIVYLGMFSTIEEASIAYNKCKINYINTIIQKYKNKLPKKVYNNLLNYNL
jgi:hypothetical protein